MTADPVYTILVGLLVGGLVGLTGLGGGVVLLPLLILGLKVPAMLAVGSGAVFSALTKVGGAASHWRQGNVDFGLVIRMAAGSIPGAVLGVYLLALLRAQFGTGINEFLTHFIGLLLIIIPLLMMGQGLAMEYKEGPLREYVPGWIKPYHGAVFTGLVGGVLVGMTSVGSGSVIMMFLILFFSRTPRTLVGTDIVHAVVLTAVAGLGHMKLGTVSFPLVGWLLVGSVPGVLLGSRLTGVVSPIWLRQVLLIILVITGIVML